ncbi:hypothetical protein [Phenylobacterium sp.]|uniref:hypothetical protein n=1 Tax=Phenylobacterium sp. TaxID=1871053 RepID=UPI00271B6D47|nr:hypothetical protein [Phenylobacterium sp.]MDO8378797.1 hypothetical protein [Phenylobacterium sp.]
MSALIAALALFAAAEPATAAPAPDELTLTEDMPYPAGAPRDDYGLVAWCYGALRGYVDLHDQMMPDVTEIEKTPPVNPETTLAEKLQAYATIQTRAKQDMKLFARAMEAAERASLKPINTIGAAAVKKGHATWAAAANMPKRQVAQNWMGWTLPVRCTPTAHALEDRAKLMGKTFQVNSDPEPETAPAPPVEPAPEPTVAPETPTQ